MKTTSCTFLIPMLFFFLIGETSVFGQVPDVCDVNNPVSLDAGITSRYFQLGPTWTSTDMLLTITLTGLCDSECEDGSSSFVIRDSQNNIVKQENFDCRQSGVWTVCITGGETYHIVVSWGCDLGNPPLQKLTLSTPIGC